MPRLIRTLALLGLGYAAVRYLSSSQAVEPQRRLSGPKADHKASRTTAQSRSAKARTPASRRTARS
ncbi:hypothetical protein CDV50_15315 [Haematobacter massiliensis]|uniref:Uncharacterized protein n=1 Tax=Haematobacter massiliensis TaxID=195105 RepID=A0A086Y143_9RHOB|nr:hypothetical protein CN97_20210 [Haematobacter massiliensis]OWJ70030.1 hypothetical protein CDV50_15315 [Haematobacter massiliensis]OWJ83350.1 hypothetical protein CDV51_16130 [Haematobacter massiliensis]